MRLFIGIFIETISQSQNSREHGIFGPSVRNGHVLRSFCAPLKLLKFADITQKTVNVFYYFGSLFPLEVSVNFQRVLG